MNVDNLMFLLCQIQNKYTRDSFRVYFRARVTQLNILWKKCEFCVPGQCMAALQDYKQRNRNCIGESREDFPQGKLSKMQPSPSFPYSIVTIHY